MADDIYSSAKSASDALMKLLKSKEDQATSAAFADYLPDIVNLRESAEESPSFLALVIGVDRYRSDTVNNLRGASADADAVMSYLQNQLKIPHSQIINLRNEDATRRRIIQGLKDLRTNETIQKCSPILIYFAGHGAHAPAPTGWNSSDGRMQMIIPHDAFTKDDGGEHVIEAIPDRTIGALLDQLAHPEDGKGDNITVIFDCCFSGSGTRDSIPAFLDDPTLLERGFVLDRTIPQDLDLDIRGACGDKDRTSAIAPGFAHAGVRSHVLLAACSDQETAKEHGGRGVFTSALLDALKSFSADKITYRDLITRVRDLPDQTPQCEGEHAGRILFNSLVPSKAHIAYSVSCSAGIYGINAGEVHGLAPGMEFSVYRSPNFSSDERPLGLLRATNVHAFTTNARLVNSPGSVLAGESDSTVLFAFQKTAGQGYSMKLHLPVRKEFHTAFEAAAQELETHRPNRRPILFVDDADDANLRIALDETGQSVRYVFADNFITRYGLTQLSRSTPREKEHIRPVLNAAASFFQYLYHSPEKNLLRKKISIGFHELAGQGFDEDLYEIMYPIEPNLIVDGRVDINVDKAAKYGITIHNNSNIPLFVSVFYFDCSTLEIQPFYTSPVQDPHVPPLGPRCSLPIGYGDSGERPRTYELPDGQNLDVGFLRIFLSTCFVDLSAFRQSSVFASARVPVEATREIRPTWDAVTIAIVQKKTRS